MSVREKIVMTDGEPVTWWLADYSDGAGRRHQRRFKTKKEAAAVHDQMKTAIRAGTHVSLPADLTVAGAHLLAEGMEGSERQARLRVFHTHRDRR